MIYLLKKNNRQKQYAKLRRRYVKSTDTSTTNFFIQRNEKIKKNLQRYQALQKTARDKRVVMHRKYRIGNYIFQKKKDSHGKNWIIYLKILWH